MKKIILLIFFILTASYYSAAMEEDKDTINHNEVKLGDDNIISEEDYGRLLELITPEGGMIDVVVGSLPSKDKKLTLISIKNCNDMHIMVVNLETFLPFYAQKKDKAKEVATLLTIVNLWDQQITNWQENVNYINDLLSDQSLTLPEAKLANFLEITGLDKKLWLNKFTSNKEIRDRNRIENTIIKATKMTIEATKSNKSTLEKRKDMIIHSFFKGGFNEELFNLFNYLTLESVKANPQTLDKHISDIERKMIDYHALLRKCGKIHETFMFRTDFDQIDFLLAQLELIINYLADLPSINSTIIDSMKACLKKYNLLYKTLIENTVEDLQNKQISNSSKVPEKNSPRRGLSEKQRLFILHQQKQIEEKDVLKNSVKSQISVKKEVTQPEGLNYYSHYLVENFKTEYKNNENQKKIKKKTTGQAYNTALTPENNNSNNKKYQEDNKNSPFIVRDSLKNIYDKLGKKDKIEFNDYLNEIKKFVEDNSAAGLISLARFNSRGTHQAFIIKKRDGDLVKTIIWSVPLMHGGNSIPQNINLRHRYKEIFHILKLF